MLLSYVLNAAGQAQSRHGRRCAERYLGAHRLHSRSRRLPERASRRRRFDQIALEQGNRAYAAEDADITLRLWQQSSSRGLRTELRHAHSLRDPGTTACRASVLGTDGTGRRSRWIVITCSRQLSADFSQRMAALEADAYEQAGPRIQYRLARNSWAKSCLTKWAWKAARKPRPAPGQTDADVLEGLAAEGPCPAQARCCRLAGQLSKLRSTYTEALREAAINPKTGRVHTSVLAWPCAHDRPPVLDRSRTCRTSRYAPRKAARSARPSWPTEGNVLVSCRL